MVEPERHPYDTTATGVLIDAMAATLSERLRNAGIDDWVLVGIERGGAHVAHALFDRLPAGGELGLVDVSFHRDDYAHRGLRTARPSQLPLSLDERLVILIDDVLHTGRTARAAIEVLFERGRPQAVWLAALAVRDGRQLPIQADVIGVHLDVPDGAQVVVSGDPPAIAVTEATE